MHWSIIGHLEQKSYLQRLVADWRLAHAYVFVGPEGVGKRLMAEDIAKAMISEGHDLDIMRLAPEKDEDGKIHDIPIEAVKGLKSWVSLKPDGAVKIIIVEDADRLGGEAANTMLKVLEEPPAYAHFFLITSSVSSMMSTILSRCERLNFFGLSAGEMENILHGQRITAKRKKLLTLVSGGSPGITLKLINNDRVGEVERAIDSLSVIFKEDIAERLVRAKKMADDPAIEDVISWWTFYLREEVRDRAELAGILHELLELSQVISEPQFNRRLAIEKCLLSWPRS